MYAEYCKPFPQRFPLDFFALNRKFGVSRVRDGKRFPVGLLQACVVSLCLPALTSVLKEWDIR